MFGFLKKQVCFSGNEEFVQEISSQEDFLFFVQKSLEAPVFLLKHSTRCPVSDWALTEFKLAAGEIKDQAFFVYLDLLAHRDVSNFISDHTGVEHQSPQLFFFQGGEVIAVASHEEVKACLIKDWLSTKR